MAGGAISELGSRVKTPARALRPGDLAVAGDAALRHALAPRVARKALTQRVEVLVRRGERPGRDLGPRASGGEKSRGEKGRGEASGNPR